MASDLQIAEGNGIMDLKKKGITTYNIDFFPLLIPSVPPFHFSIIPCGLQPRRLQKTKFFSRLKKFQGVN